MVTNRDGKENHLGRPEIIPNVAQTTGTVELFDPHSGDLGPSSQGASALSNLHEWWTQPTHMRCPDADLLI